MTGSGTEQDPIIVANWDEFTTATETTPDGYIKWADSDNKFIDFNNIKPEGFDEVIYFPANVDFNGWTLRNFASSSNYAIRYKSKSGIIENLILENIYISSQYLIYGNYELKNCQFSGRIQSNSNVYVFSACGLNTCSANISINSAGMVYMVNDSGFSSPKAWIKKSDIILDISTKGNSVYIAKNSLINSRISGKVVMGNTSYLWLGGSGSMSNVINLESNVKLRLFGGISVFNSDIADTDSPDVLIACTAEQLKNPEYLASIGFPIGV